MLFKIGFCSGPLSPQKYHRGGCIPAVFGEWGRWGCVLHPRRMLTSTVWLCSSHHTVFLFLRSLGPHTVNGSRGGAPDAGCWFSYLLLLSPCLIVRFPGICATWEQKAPVLAVERWVGKWFKLLHVPDKSHWCSLVAAGGGGGAMDCSALPSRNGGVWVSAVLGLQAGT